LPDVYDVTAFPDAIGIPDGPVFVVCDDCHEAYMEPAYYTFEVSACKTTESTPDGETVIDHMNTLEGCTGNLCPDCAGPYIAPDVLPDPRDPAPHLK